MLQFFLELIIALLAVYGAYSALHEIVALLEKIVGLRSPDRKRENLIEPRKEDSHDREGESGRTDHIGRDN